MAFKSGPVITFKYHGKHKETTIFFLWGGGGGGGGLICIGCVNMDAVFRELGVKPLLLKIVQSTTRAYLTLCVHDQMYGIHVRRSTHLFYAALVQASVLFRNVVNVQHQCPVGKGFHCKP